MFEAYALTNLKIEALWLDFLTSFSPHTINALKSPMLSRWCALIVDRGFNIRSGRRIPKARSLIDVLYRKFYILPNGKREKLPNQERVFEPPQAKYKLPFNTAPGEEVKRELGMTGNLM